LTTDGRVLFPGDNSGNALALDPLTGSTLWHVNLGGVMDNAPITYELDGRQYLLFAAGDSLFGFTLPLKACAASSSSDRKSRASEVSGPHSR
jgi:hypothetical protein